MIALDSCGQLSAEQPLAAMLLARGQVQDSDFAEALELTVSCKARTTLTVKQTSVLSNSHYCVSQHTVHAGAQQQLLLPKLRGLSQITITSTAEATMHSLSMVAAPANMQRSYDSTATLQNKTTSHVAFADRLLVLLGNRNIAVIVSPEALKLNEARLFAINSAYKPIAIRTSNFTAELVGTVQLLDDYLSCYLELQILAISPAEVTVAITKLAQSTPQSRLFTNEQIIHVQL